MEKVSLAGRGTRDGIYRPPKSTILLNQEGIEPEANLIGTGVDKLQLQDSLSTGKQRWETRRVK